MKDLELLKVVRLRPDPEDRPYLQVNVHFRYNNMEAIKRGKHPLPIWNGWYLLQEIKEVLQNCVDKNYEAWTDAEIEGLIALIKQA